MKLSGIYKIVNKTNGKYYIGSSNDIRARWSHHKNSLQLNKHHNDYLQSSWNKYGKDNFDFFIIENVLPNDLLITEQKYLDIANAEQNNCYNLEFKSTGGQWSEHTRNKMRGINNPNYGKAWGGNHYGNSHFKGKKHSDETKKKMREAAKRRIVSNETRNKLSNTSKGRYVSPETRRKISETLKSRRQNLSPATATI